MLIFVRFNVASEYYFLPSLMLIFFFFFLTHFLSITHNNFVIFQANIPHVD